MQGHVGDSVRSDHSKPSGPTPSKPKFWYAVARTNVANGVGTYPTWDDAKAFCIDSETGKPIRGAKFKKFSTWAEAAQFVKDNSTPLQLAGSTPTATTGRKRKEFVATMDENPAASCGDVRPSGKQGKRARNGSHGDEVSGSSSVGSSSCINVYTDGSCLNNGKSGARAGYGVYFGDGDCRNVSARLPGEPQTNQRAELYAIKTALEKCKEAMQDKLVIHSDSEYSRKCLTEWVDKWSKNNWVTSQKTEVKNKDLIRPMYEMVKERGNNIGFIWVKAHSGIEGNEKADQLARQGGSMKVVR